jgi:acetylornithine deacetylase/succinyl-diaminopimelate desuccinylase-like protein
LLGEPEAVKCIAIAGIFLDCVPKFDGRVVVKARGESAVTLLEIVRTRGAGSEETQSEQRRATGQLVSDPAVKVTMPQTDGPTSPAPPLTAAILGPIEKLTAEFWPGVPVLPILQAGATDGRFMNAAGIPTYGVEPVFVGPDLGHIHGLNEYVGVKSLPRA